MQHHHTITGPIPNVSALTAQGVTNNTLLGNRALIWFCNVKQTEKEKKKIWHAWYRRASFTYLYIYIYLLWFLTILLSTKQVCCIATCETQHQLSTMPLTSTSCCSRTVHEFLQMAVFVKTWLKSSEGCRFFKCAKNSFGIFFQIWQSPLWGGNILIIWLPEQQK